MSHNIADNYDIKRRIKCRCKRAKERSYPDKTPRTRLSMKNEPMMMRGIKYNQFQVFPEASLVYENK